MPSINQIGDVVCKHLANNPELRHLKWTPDLGPPVNRFSRAHKPLLGRELPWALNLVRHNGNPKESLKCRRLRASLNDNYRWQLLTGEQT